MTEDELDILDFYRSGATMEQLCYSYDISMYRMKKFLSNEPSNETSGYLWRRLFPSGKKET